MRSRAVLSNQLPGPISARLQCADNEAAVAAIRGPERRPPRLAADWPLFPHEFPEISGQSLGINGVLLLSLIASRGSLFPDPSPVRYRGAETRQTEEFLVAIRSREVGRPEWRRAGRDFPSVARESRTNYWRLTASSFWGLVEAKDSLFSAVLTGWFARLLSVLPVRPATHVRGTQRGN